MGFTIGLTGVGGGSLMTPILLMLGIPPHIAVGTDLMYASLTKASGTLVHKRQHTISWRPVFLLSIGSIPASLLTIYFLHTFFPDAESYKKLLTNTLGVMLILTSMVLIFRRKLQPSNQGDRNSVQTLVANNAELLTIIMGLVLGVLVTLSSVGAGALGTAILLILYPRLTAVNIVGTDVAHAVLLTFIAGIGHLSLGNVDYLLLISLLVGSIPAVYVGTKLGAKLPDKILQPILIAILLGLGIKYIFF